MWCEHELVKMISKNYVPFPMLSDLGGKIGQLYGVYSKEMGMNIRGTFIIDPDGTLQAIEVLSPAVGRNLSEHLRLLKAFQHVRKHTEQVLPSDWTPEDDVLVPTPNLVGRIWERWKPKKN